MIRFIGIAAVAFAVLALLSSVVPDMADGRSKVRRHKLPVARVSRAVKQALRKKLDMLPGEVQSLKIKGLKPLPMPGAGAIVEVGFRQNEDFTGKVPVEVRILHNGKLFHSAWVTANVKRTVPIVHAAKRLSRGHLLTSSDMNIRQIDAARAPARAVTLPADVLGMEVRTPVRKGRPLKRSGLKRPNLVERGALVTLVAGRGGVRVTAPGRVEQAGARNAIVRVTNLASKRILYGRVVDTGHVLLSVN